VWEWIEGSRSFDEAWGLATAALCPALAVPILWWRLPEQRRSFFGPAIDPRYGLQLGYGIFCMALLIALALVAGLGPRVLVLALGSHQRTAS
jgi:hypothetical protein